MKASLTFLLIFFTTGIFAGGENEKTYRVVAIQSGNQDITSVSNEVNVILSARLYIPNAFTPDGDGLNDTWGAVGQGLSEFRLQVFNRWGEMIFESDDINKTWDGTWLNEKVQDGVYVYKVSGRSADMLSYYNTTGSVTLVR